MRNLTRFLLATICGLLLAVGVHIASILASPHYAERDAYSKLEKLEPAENAQIIAAPGAQETWVPMPDPAVAVAACTYDLRDGPMRVSARTGQLFLSFSFRTETGDVFFAVTDRAAVRGSLEIVALTARQLDEARAEEDENEPSRDVRVVAPQPRGYVIVRVASPTVSQRADAEAAAKAVSCTVDGDEE